MGSRPHGSCRAEKRKGQGEVNVSCGAASQAVLCGCHWESAMNSRLLSDCLNRAFYKFVIETEFHFNKADETPNLFYMCFIH